MPHTKDILISIVTVCYNCESSIEKTIESVKSQSCKCFEYIVIDGKSTDGTTSTIAEHRSAVDYFISEADDGIYDAMNKGVEAAKGKWILFLNSGDYFANSDIIASVKNSLSPSKADVIYSNILVESKQALKLRKAPKPCNKHRMFFCHQSAFTQTKWLKKYPFDKRFKMSSDFHFFKKCYRNGAVFSHIEIAPTVFDLNGISNTNRLAGLYENTQIVRELDSGIERFLFLIRLYAVIFRIKLTN